MKGLFLHHELIQPRIKGGFGFHAVGPTPGFTQATMDRLALCYIAAAVRRGSFLIPAFHCVLDIGLPDGHDDPQNFDLFQWVGAIEKILGEITTPVVAHELALESVETEAPAPEIETVRSDISDGERNVKIRRIKGTKPVFFKAKLAIDADGAARAYHPDKQNPECAGRYRQRQQLFEEVHPGQIEKRENRQRPPPRFLRFSDQPATRSGF